MYVCQPSNNPEAASNIPGIVPDKKAIMGKPGYGRKFADSRKWGPS